MIDYTKLLNEFPEINPANYGDDEVNALNAWGIAAHTAIEALKSENEQLTYELQVIEENHFQLKKERDALQAKLDEVLEPQPPCEATLHACISYVIHGDADFSGLPPGLVEYFKEHAAPKALAPLTDEQIYNVFASTVEDAEPFSELVGDPIWAEVVEITRAIEAAHGIK